MSRETLLKAWKIVKEQKIRENILTRKIWKFEISEYLILIMVLFYTTIFLYYSILKHHSLRTYAWDIGIILQSLSSTLKGFLFKNNVELYFSPTGTYFGVHFAPIYFLIVPFFMILPKIETLFFIQSLILSMSVIPFYLIAKHYINNRTNILLLSASYFLNPLLHSMNWYDFLPQTFLPILILSSTYFLKKRNLVLSMLFVILSLMTLEQTSYFIMLFSVYVFYELKGDIINSIKAKKISGSIIMPILIILITFFWYIFASKMIYSFNPTRSAEFESIENFSFLNIRHMSELPRQIIVNFDLALKAIRYNFSSKILYVLVTFATTGFIALLRPFAILPSLLWLFLALLSNWAPYYELGFQYTGLTLPFLSIGLIEGLNEISSTVKTDKIKLLRKLSFLLLFIGVVLGVVASPLSPLQTPGDYSYFHDYGITVPSLVDGTVIETLRIIPDNAMTLITASAFPQIATNINAYTIPPIDAPSPRIYDEHLRYLKNIEFEYIVIDVINDRGQSEVLFSNFIEENEGYGLYVKSAGLYIYKKDYSLDPINVNLSFNYQELTVSINSVVKKDKSSSSGKVILLKASSDSGKTSWFGPYTTLIPGDYIANFKIRIDHPPEEHVMRLDIAINGGSQVVAFLDVDIDDFSKPLMWHTFSVPFSIKEKSTGVEYRGIRAQKETNIWLDYIEIVPQ